MLKVPLQPIADSFGQQFVSFGTDGIRGHFGKVLTPSLAKQTGYWLGTILEGDGPVIIGRDSRLSGNILCEALSKGIRAAGLDVWDIGLCPTPAVPLLIQELEAAGGVMISASHNPPEDNGIKLFTQDGTKIDQKRQQIIEDGVNGKSLPEKNLNLKKTCLGKSYERADLLQLYKNSLIESVGNRRLKGVPIVLDLCWGSATACALEPFKALGANLTILHGSPDGAQINVACGSTNINPLKSAVIEQGAMMGFAFDGDADRVIAVDGEGRVLDGDHLLYLWGADLQDDGALPEGKLVSTVMSNLGFEQAWIARGGALTRTPVGDKHVHAEMLQNGAALGGEQSGHILSRLNGMIGDGLLTALQMATRCNAPDRTLYEWRNESFDPFPQKLINIKLNENAHSKNWFEYQPLKEAVLDAQKAMGNNGRVLLRASGTEPVLRVMVEASDPKEVEAWSSKLVDLASKYFSAG